MGEDGQNKVHTHKRKTKITNDALSYGNVKQKNVGWVGVGASWMNCFQGGGGLKMNDFASFH